MVLTKKFSQFNVAALDDAAQEVVGLENGVNIRSTRFLTWTVATRPAIPFNGLLGYNTELQKYEFYDAAVPEWVQLEDSTDPSQILALLASHLPGEGASLIGLQNQSNVTDKTVQDLANAAFIAQTDNGTLENAQFLGSLTTGIVKNTTVTGVLSISAPLTSIDGLTTVANNMLYTTAPDTYDVIAPLNDALLISSAAGVPSWSNSAIPSFTMAGTIGMGNYHIEDLANPVNPQDAVTKAYVDEIALSGTAVYAATVSNLSATQAGSGVGATLTDDSGTFAVFTLDGVNPPLGSNVLVKDYANAANEGIYTLTTQGDGVSIPWQLTRATTYNTPEEINNTGLIAIQNGTQAGEAWLNVTTIVTVDTTPFNYVQFGAGGSVSSITAGVGLTATPNPIVSSGTIDADGLLASIYTNNTAGAENFIFGGNFDTNPWQRGTSFTGITSPFNNYTADRFRFITTATPAVLTVRQSTDAPALANSGIFTQTSLDMEVTTADASVAANDFLAFRYRMEGYDWSQLAQRSFTLSFWVKATVTGTYSISFLNGISPDRAYIQEYTINSADTWEFKTITVPASPSAGTWNYTNGVGLEIVWTIMAGSDYFNTVGSWIVATALTRCSANQVNGVNAIGNRFKLQLVKIEPGTVATPWQIRSFEEELALCQRYFQSFGGDAASQGIMAGFANTTNATSMILEYAQAMRTIPTLAVSDASNFNIVYQNTSAAATSILYTTNGAGTKKATTTNGITGTPLTAGEGVYMRANTTNARLTLSAEM